jgi:hypothetical protein
VETRASPPAWAPRVRRSVPSLTMQVDFAVELGRDDETLEFPWAGPADGPRYYDLKRNPDLLEQVEEATGVAELRDFLISVNSPSSILESAKCDTWSTSEINPEEEIFNLPWKFGSYVDLLLSDQAARLSFELHETLLKQIIGLLQRVPEIPASAEFLLRRCFYHERNVVREGYYVTSYLVGFGEDKAKARQQWGIALKLVAGVIAQLSSRLSTL